MKNIPIGEVLKEYGYISEEQLQTALAEQKKDRSKRLGQHLIDLGFISEKQMLKALSDKLNEPLVDMNNVEIEVDAVAKIPKTLALKYDLIAISENNGRLTVVTSDPLNFYGIEDVRLVTGMNLAICLSEKKEILRAIDYYMRKSRHVKLPVWQMKMLFLLNLMKVNYLILKKMIHRLLNCLALC